MWDSLILIQVAFFSRTVYPPRISQRSSDDEDHGGRSPPLEVSDEECLRDRVPYVTSAELGKDSYYLYIHSDVFSKSLSWVLIVCKPEFACWKICS